jgi:hypothetical protein
MSWRAKIWDLETGHFLASLTVKANDMHQAEARAIAKTSLVLRADPRRLTVRQLHQQGGPEE